MTLANSDIPSAPLDANTSDQQYNRLVNRVGEIQQYLGDNLRGPDGRGGRPGMPDIFIGYTASSPPNGGSGSTYTDARYYVVRCVAPDPNGGRPTYDKQGSLTENLSINDDPFAGKMSLPTYVVATNLAELTGHVTDTSGSPGTHLLHDNTIVLVIGFTSRANPVKRTYVFMQPLPRGLFPVNLTQSGGSNGSAGVVATYTYNATNAITGASISGGPFAVTWARANGLVNAATHGTMYVGSDGTYHLWQADETPMDDTCS